MDDILSSLSTKIISLNPTLLPNPPPIIEETNGNDICYQNPIIYCKDLYFGMRGVVGSWFLSPSRIIIETMVVVLFSLVIIYSIKPVISDMRVKSNNSIGGNAKSQLSSSSSLSFSSLRPPKTMRIATVLILSLQVVYKVCGYPGKILVMVMPCNILWMLNIILCYSYPYPTATNNNKSSSNINSSKVLESSESSYQKLAYTILQLQCSYIALVFVALSNPDFSDTVLYGEVYFFYIHHLFLLYYVSHYIFITGQVSTLGVNNTYGNYNYNDNDNRTTTVVNGIKDFFSWTLLSCSYFAFFYFGIVTPLSIQSGLNLNYMLHPPPNQDDLVGQGYRMMSIVYCVVSFVVMRMIIIVLELIWRKVLFLYLGRSKLVIERYDDNLAAQKKKI